MQHKYNHLANTAVFVTGTCTHRKNHELGVGFVYKEVDDGYIILTTKHVVMHNLTHHLREVEYIEACQWQESDWSTLLTKKARQLLFLQGKKTDLPVIDYGVSKNNNFDLCFIKVEKTIPMKMLPFSSSYETCYCLRNKYGISIQLFQGVPEKRYFALDTFDGNSLFHGQIQSGSTEEVPLHRYLRAARMDKVSIGMSGSPLINQDGHILGMVVAMDKTESCALYYDMHQIETVYQEVKHNLLTPKNIAYGTI